ncbi:MAG: hypothetical protein IPL81_00770 [Flavobacteriales bacterium]|jgi:hypothetical protein|nr:hypothetical protein [Flavobacteriales bacterium]MBK7249309.1 hypothetical protein [Flavobacteriales bacterium]MBK7285862.1 hypothetical protein [Flavobacteriales bacterium]MBK9058456.1 hypothetical protein [Flavobacteriales bacterium]QQS71527.1 MAG: hypothetical protein IPP95_10035 [Flavobacteriales bacterium]
MRKAAHTLSLLLHPVWMPTFAVIIAFHIDPHLTFAFTPQGQWVIVGMVFVMSALFPISSMFMLWRSGAVSKLAMPDRKERIVPYLLTLIYFCMTYYLLRRSPNHPATLALFCGIIIALVVDLVITIRWKISLHMTGIGGLIGMVLGLMVLHGTPVGFAPILLVMTGALGTARLLVTDHSPAQIYAGALVGLASTFLCLLFGINY